MHQRVLGALFAGFFALTPGCATCFVVLSESMAPTHVPRSFVGTRTWITGEYLEGDMFPLRLTLGTLLGLIDLPFSLVADLIILPWTLSESWDYDSAEERRREPHSQALDLAIELLERGDVDGLVERLRHASSGTPEGKLRDLLEGLEAWKAGDLEEADHRVVSQYWRLRRVLDEDDPRFSRLQELLGPYREH